MESLITIFFIERNEFIEGNDLLDLQRLIYLFFSWHLNLSTQIVGRSENSWKCFKGLKILSNYLMFPLIKEVNWKERERAASVEPFRHQRLHWHWIFGFLRTNVMSWRYPQVNAELINTASPRLKTLLKTWALPQEEEKKILVRCCFSSTLYWEGIQKLEYFFPKVILQIAGEKNIIVSENFVYCSDLGQIVFAYCITI